MISSLLPELIQFISLIVLGDHTAGTFRSCMGIALVGINTGRSLITCPKWFSSLIYIAIDGVSAIPKIIAALPAGGFSSGFLAGGNIYTVQEEFFIYALKLPIFNSRHQYFGSYEIFHLFVMGAVLPLYDDVSVRGIKLTF